MENPENIYHLGSGKRLTFSRNNYNSEYTVYVKNLNSKVTEELLLELFIQCGPVRSVRIPRKNEQHDMMYAFVEFEDVESVPYACFLFDGIQLYSCPINVQPQMNHQNVLPEHDRKKRRV